MNPENKSETFTKGKDINSVMCNRFNSFGKESSIDLKLKKKIEDFISNVNNNEVSVNSPILLKFSKEQIGNIANRLHSGKSSGIDEIPNEFLKFGGELLVNSLVDLFTVISDLETIPDEWGKGIIKSLHKSGTDFYIDNYKVITLTSNVYKVYSKVLEEIVMNYLEENNVLGEVQGAVRKGRRTEDYIFTLQGIYVLFVNKKKCKTYLAFLDLSKAFDRVWRDGLFYLLWKNGIQGKCWKLLKSLYSKVSNKVLFGQHETEFFDQEFGLKQRCILSPTLFSVLMNDLVSML